MPRWPGRSHTLARRSLPLAMGGVVVVFVAATVYSQRLLSGDVEALDIAGNSAPSIAALADVRAELRELGRIAVANDGGGVWPEHRKRLDVALADYERTPQYVGEAALADDVHRQLLRLDALVPGHASGVEIAQTIDELDGSLFALSELNRRHLVEAAEAIARSGRRRNLYAFALDAVAIVIAFAVTLLAARTVDRYLRALDRRTRELEHLAIQVGHEIANPLGPIQVALHQAAATADETERAGLERAQRSLGRIQETIAWLVAFAKAGHVTAAPRPRAPLRPALVEAARAAGCQADTDGDVHVAFAEPVLRELLRDLFAGSVRPGGPPLSAVEVARSSRHVRIALVRAAAGGGGDPFEPQLHIPGAEYPGLDLRLATVRRYVEAAGGAVGVRRARQREELWVELPAA